MKKIFHQTILLVAALLLVAASAPATEFAILHTFSARTSSPGTNSDGSGPESDLVADSGGTLYGTTTDGGPAEGGSIFAITTGGALTPLYGFDFENPTNGEGPTAGMVVSGGILYGTARAGGTNGLGTIFSLTADGKTFTKLHDFGLRIGRDTSTELELNTNSGGAFPETDLVISGNTLFGATEQGGTGGNGILFKINTDGSSFTVLHNFTNADGGFPSVHMVVSGNNLYGTTEFGGVDVGGEGGGTIFRISTAGTGFTNLFFFDEAANQPLAGLVMSGNVLYGTTTEGTPGPGGAPFGSVFKINPDGTGFTNFYILDSNLNAGDPRSGLAINGNTIYATSLGFDAFGGTVFQVNTDGTGYTNLTSFNNQGDPGTLSGVTFLGGSLYCTSSSGGTNNSGTVFALGVSPAPVPLNLKLAGNTVILTWNAPSLSLYAAPTLTNQFVKINNATSPYTNVISGTQQYFLIK
jgi:uncharacterized repeat protein (TIGR03803 family)